MIVICKLNILNTLILPHYNNAVLLLNGMTAKGRALFMRLPCRFFFHSAAATLIVLSTLLRTVANCCEPTNHRCSAAPTAEFFLLGLCGGRLCCV